MMNNQAFDNQLQMFGQMAKQNGISGAAYIDADPASGILRVKLKVTPVEEQARLISAIAYVLSQVSQGFGLQVNILARKMRRSIMDNFGYIFGYMMERTMTMIAYCTFATFIEKILEDERKKVKAALGHEPTQENWQDYYELKQEKTDRQKADQREIDKKKLRRLVMGELDAAADAG
jgi:hypothetical protein